MCVFGLFEMLGMVKRCIVFALCVQHGNVCVVVVFVLLTVQFSCVSCYSILQTDGESGKRCTYLNGMVKGGQSRVKG